MYNVSITKFPGGGGSTRGASPYNLLVVGGAIVPMVGVGAYMDMVCSLTASLVCWGW